MARRTRKRGRLFTLGLMVGLAGLLSSTAYVDAPDSAPATAPVAALETDPIRDTEAEALLAAKALNQPVEVLAERSEYRDVFAQPDGTLVANEHTQAVRVLQNDAWVPADATLVAQPDGTYAPTAALLNMRLSNGGTTPLMVAERDSRVMTLTWPNPLPAPTVNGDQLVYPEVFQGVDLVAFVTVEGFSHVLVLKTPEAANLPELQNLRLGVTGEGLTIQETEDGGIVALDPATGNPVMEADAPTMWDSGSQEGGEAATSGLRSSAMADTDTGSEDPNEASARGPGEASQVAQVGLSYSQGTLSLTPDAAMLADPDTTYPVYVDPVWQGSTNSAWAMVDSGYPSEEYWKFDGKRHERIGRCPSSCNNSLVKRLFYRLSTPYAGKTILEAKLRVTMQHVYNSTARAAALYLMPAGIATTTNWSNQPGGSSWSTATHLDTNSPTSVQSTCTSTNQNTEWDAKVAVQTAVAKGWSNVTLGLKSVNESDSTHTKRFCDNAVLSVRYNRAPLIPNQSELLMSPGGACVYGTNVPYTPEAPRLDAYLRDPDHSSSHTEQVQAEFRVTYTAPGSSTPTVLLSKTAFKASGSKFSYEVSESIPQNVTVSWDVRGGDGVSWGPWSSDGTRNVCQFIVDKTSPTPPDVDSAQYLPLDATDTTSDCKDDDEWRGSIGVVGSFTFDSAATDVVEYLYNFNGGTDISVKPATAGGPVTINWTPDKEGPRQLFVKAVDAAKRASSPATCTFRVGKRPPVAQWPMADAAGSTRADNSRGPNDATVGSGVTFATTNNFREWDRAAIFDGTSNAYMVTDKAVLADTSQSFAITGWFRTDDVNRRQIAVSQDGTGDSGFSLGVDQGQWFFRMPTNDLINIGEWRVKTTTGVTTDWTFVTAIFDGPNKKISIQADNNPPVEWQRRSLTRARGPLQLGRNTYKGGGYSDFWKGGMADVSVFDRPIVTEDSTGLQKQLLNRKAYWQLNDQTSGQSPEVGNGSPLALSKQSLLFKTPTPIGRMVGTGHLRLSGKPDEYAQSSSALVDPTGSFTITARVKLTSGSNNHAMTAFSVKGPNNSAVIVRANSQGKWELAATTDDTAGAVFQSKETERTPRMVGAGDHLALVYDGYTRQLTLWVEGESTELEPLTVPFKPTSMSSLQLGRAFLGATPGEHLSGNIDEVRIYDGVADKVKIDKLRLIGEAPTI
ncbi:concanavalin A-like lectin/glucanase superfamily protein [Micromonospora palomenae]|uniref:Concanavalin A-like lectin/glucanase superfamily protein n=2 Tax=Micromonospora palomenae TaxID=1461247 RepID=A0A561VH44_9ACTN|nr:concanavalin A-like lectin/glucanase superfamily protein [Micromonospora palomenae]